MQYENSKIIKDHLEWLGYSVEDHSQEGSAVDWLVANHDQHYNLLVSHNAYGVIYFIVKVYGLECFKRPVVEQLQALNGINAKTTFSKWELVHAEKEADQHCFVSAYLLEYNKKHFGSLVGSLNQDINQHLQKLNLVS